MDLHIQYITDQNGVKTAVQIPYNEWVKFSSRYKHLLQYSRLKKGFDNAFDEIEQIKENRIDMVTLDEFLNES
jgi:hypothetical protein